MKNIRNTALFLILSVSASALSAPGTHVVQPGETLWRIAEVQFGSGERWVDIAELNGITNPSELKEGQLLILHGDDSDGDSIVPGSSDISITSDSASAMQGAKILSNTELVIREHVDRGSKDESDIYLTSIQQRDSIRDEFRGAYKANQVSEGDASIEIEDFETAARMALKNNARFIAIEKDVAAARAGLKTAQLADRMNPEFEIEGARRRSASEAGEPRKTSTDWGFGVSREFEIGGQRSHRISVAELEIQVAVSEAELARRQMLFEIKDAYTHYLEKKEALELSRVAAETKMDLAEMVRVRYEAGDASGIEVSLAEVNGLRAHDKFLEAKGVYAMAHARLRKMIGLTEHQKIVVSGRLDTPGEDGNFHYQIATVALAQRQDLRILRLESDLETERAQLEIAEGRSNISFGVGYENEEGADVFKGMFGLPLPLTNRKTGDAERSRSKASAAHERAQALEREITIEVESAIESVSSARARYSILMKRVKPQSEENLRLLKEAYKEGEVGLAEVILLQAETLEARREFLDAVMDYNENERELEKAMGIDLLADRQGGAGW